MTDANSTAATPRLPGHVKLLVVILVLMGLVLLLEGAWLAILGGSIYYSFAGCMLLVSAVLLAKCHIGGAWAYYFFLVVTVAWSCWEVGVDMWPLFPRLVVPLLVALAVATSTRVMYVKGRSRRFVRATSLVVSGLASAALLVFAIVAFVPKNIVSGNDLSPSRTINISNTDTEWRHYGRTTAGTRFSPAEQINAGNVNRLQIAWVYRTGDPQHPFGEYQVTPLQVGETLYLCTDSNVVIALDAESGKQKWRFDPDAPKSAWQRCRGVGYHERSQGSATARGSTCQRRVITSTTDSRLIALDGDRGTLCQDFGVNGVVDLKLGMGEVKSEYYRPTSAPLVAGDLVIVGGMVRDNVTVGMPSGVVRAFDANTGALTWAWDPGNPAITGLPRKGESYTRGSPNMWSTGSYDPKLKLIYVPLGSATGANDHWGGWRDENIEYYSNSVVALDAATGRPRWRFQTVHHDLWDYDLPPQPTLFDIPDGTGGTVPALIQGTKRGEIFLLDRRDGTPISPVMERPVPQGGQADDWTSVTQPYSVGMPALGTEPLTETRMWGITPFDQLWCRIQFRRLRYEGQFTPPTLAERTLFYPSLWGGMNWGGVTVDERRRYLIANDIRVPWVLQLNSRVEYNEQVAQFLKGGRPTGLWPLEPLPPDVPYGRSVAPFFSPLSVPCNAPPWGTLTGIDLATRKIVWQIPAGTARDTGPLGLTLALPLAIGLPTLGGSLATGSGLVFFSGTGDFYLRAIDINTGVELWKGRLPVGSQATPMTYISPRSGRQFVVVVAGGNSASKKKGDYVIAFALDKDT
jgi:quinate dehydrogenase (quinone)